MGNEKTYKNLAVIFPGIGYHTDKPLLYYGKKLAAAADCRILEVSYGGFAGKIKGNKKKMEEAFCSARDQTEKILQGTDFDGYDRILFIANKGIAECGNHDELIAARGNYYELYTAQLES